MNRETNAERLERIKEIQEHANTVYEYGDPAMELHDIVIQLWEHEHTDWLIEQAEENARLRNALEFYADEENYTRSLGDYEIGYPEEVLMDKGNKAKTALEGEG